MSRTPTPLYREISSLLSAIENCKKRNNTEWEDKHTVSLDTLVGFLPSGGGIDMGPKLDTDKSTPEKLVFHFSYHHMNENGYYDGWTDHTLTVRPSLQFGIDTRISGRDRNQIKEYLFDTFHHALTAKVWQDENGKWYSEAFGHVFVPETAPI